MSGNLEKRFIENIESGFIWRVKRALDAKKELLNTQSKSGYTPLIHAIGAGHLGIAELLISEGADVNAADSSGYTPLMWSIVLGCHTTRALLKSKGAKLHTNEKHELWLHAAFDGKLDLLKNSDLITDKTIALELLFMASAGGRVTVIDWLLTTHRALVRADSQNDEKWTSACIAAANNQSDAIKFLVGKKIRLTGLGPKDMTPLHFAASRGHNELVCELVDSYSSIHEKCKEGFTAITYAALNGQCATVELLHKKTTKPNLASDYYIAALLFAAASGHTQNVKFLIETAKVAVNSKLTREYYCGCENALMIATVNNRIETCKYLVLAAKASITLTNSSELTPFLLAVQENHLELAQWHREQLRAALSPKDFRKQDFRAMHIAAENGSIDVLKWLFAIDKEIYAGEMAVDMPNSSNSQYYTPFLGSVANGEIAAAQEFLALRPNAINEKSDFDESALWLAVASGNLNLVKLLLTKGAKLSEFDEENAQNILHWAAIQGHVDILEFILDNPTWWVDINAGDIYGCTALQLAASKRHKDAVKFLLSRGAGLNADLCLEEEEDTKPFEIKIDEKAAATYLTIDLKIVNVSFKQLKNTINTIEKFIAALPTLPIKTIISILINCDNQLENNNELHMVMVVKTIVLTHLIANFSQAKGDKNNQLQILRMLQLYQHNLAELASEAKYTYARLLENCCGLIVCTPKLVTINCDKAQQVYREIASSHSLAPFELKKYKPKPPSSSNLLSLPTVPTAKQPIHIAAATRTTPAEDKFVALSTVQSPRTEARVEEKVSEEPASNTKVNSENERDNPVEISCITPEDNKEHERDKRAELPGITAEDNNARKQLAIKKDELIKSAIEFLRLIKPLAAEFEQHYKSVLKDIDQIGEKNSIISYLEDFNYAPDKSLTKIFREAKSALNKIKDTAKSLASYYQDKKCDMHEKSLEELTQPSSACNEQTLKKLEEIGAQLKSVYSEITAEKITVQKYPASLADLKQLLDKFSEKEITCPHVVTPASEPKAKSPPKTECISSNLKDKAVIPVKPAAAIPKESKELEKPERSLQERKPVQPPVLTSTAKIQAIMPEPSPKTAQLPKPDGAAPQKSKNPVQPEQPSQEKKPAPPASISLTAKKQVTTLESLQNTTPLPKPAAAKNPPNLLQCLGGIAITANNIHEITPPQPLPMLTCNYSKAEIIANIISLINDLNNAVDHLKKNCPVDNIDILNLNYPVIACLFEIFLNVLILTKKVNALAFSRNDESINLENILEAYYLLLSLQTHSIPHSLILSLAEVVLKHNLEFIVSALIRLDIQKQNLIEYQTSTNSFISNLQSLGQEYLWLNTLTFTQHLQAIATHIRSMEAVGNVYFNLNNKDERNTFLSCIGFIAHCLGFHLHGIAHHLPLIENNFVYKDCIANRNSFCNINPRNYFAKLMQHTLGIDANNNSVGKKFDQQDLISIWQANKSFLPLAEAFTVRTHMYLCAATKRTPEPTPDKEGEEFAIEFLQSIDHFDDPNFQDDDDDDTTNNEPLATPQFVRR